MDSKSVLIFFFSSSGYWVIENFTSFKQNISETHATPGGRNWFILTVKNLHLIDVYGKLV